MDYATDDERLPPRLAKIDAISAQQIVPRQLAVPAGVDDFLKLSRLRQQPPSHRADPHQATRPLGAFVFDDQGLAEHFLGDHVPATLTRHPSKKGSSSPSRVRHMVVPTRSRLSGSPRSRPATHGSNHTSSSYKFDPRHHDRTPPNAVAVMIAVTTPCCSKPASASGLAPLQHKVGSKGSLQPPLSPPSLSPTPLGGPTPPNTLAHQQPPTFSPPPPPPPPTLSKLSAGGSKSSTAAARAAARIAEAAATCTPASASIAGYCTPLTLGLSNNDTRSAGGGALPASLPPRRNASKPSPARFDHTPAAAAHMMGHHNMFHQPPLPQPDEWTQVGTANISAPSGVMMRASTSTSLLRVASSPRPGPALMEPRSPTTAPSPPTNTPAKAAESQTSTQLGTNYKEAHGHFPRDLPLLRPQLGGPPYLYSPSRISCANNIEPVVRPKACRYFCTPAGDAQRRVDDQQGLQPHTPQPPL